MWRLQFKVRLVKVPTTLALQAAGEEPSAIGRWFEANLDLKTLLAIVGVSITLFGMRTSTQADIASLREQNRQQATQIADLGGKTTRTNQRVADDTVPRACYEHDAAVTNQVLGILLQNALTTSPPHYAAPRTPTRSYR